MEKAFEKGRAVFVNTTKVSHVQLSKNVGKDYRHSLQSVYVDLKNSCLVVTDAHVLIMYPINVLENTTGKDGFMVQLQLFNTSKYMDDVSEYLFSMSYVLEPNYCKVIIGDIEEPFETVFRCKYHLAQANGGKYPNYQNVIPNEKEIQGVPKIALNFVLLKRICDAIPNGKEFVFSFFANNKAVLLTQKDEMLPEPIKAIIMPIMLGNG